VPLFAIPFPAIDPNAIAFGPIAIKWYALAYIGGLVFGWLYARWLVQRPASWTGAPKVLPIHLDDFILYAAVGVILGGRLGYVLFYNLEYFLLNPAEIPMIWGGGMSFHGGFAGMLIAVAIFCRTRGIPVLTFLDVLAAVTPIGLFLGRIANFINGELWGRITDVPWAVIFPTGGPFPRHPSQLYQAALEGLVLFAIVSHVVYWSGFKRPGEVGGAFVAGYGLMRIIGEFFREPDPQIGFIGGWMTMGMILSLPMVAVGLYAFLRARR
jgi:phosphatidylglycerol---prolipoprotein diacylglyceryl transferase